jgi:phosphatidylcholine synthase
MKPTIRIIFAWAVHLYTASGLLVAALMAVQIVRGGDSRFRIALLLMMLATFIDSTDGFLARRAQVKVYVPRFDGRRLDDLVDFLTYTCLPLLLVWRTDLLPGSWAGLLLFPLLASAYGFSQADAKTDDGYFLGFPSYWNVVAIYLYLLHPALWISVGLNILLSILTFVPSRYLYPSQQTRFRGLTIIASLIWVGVLAAIVWMQPPASRSLTLASLVFPAAYLSGSWAISVAGYLKRSKEA